MHHARGSLVYCSPRSDNSYPNSVLDFTNVFDNLNKTVRWITGSQVDDLNRAGKAIARMGTLPFMETMERLQKTLNDMAEPFKRLAEMQVNSSAFDKLEFQPYVAELSSGMEQAISSTPGHK